MCRGAMLFFSLFLVTVLSGCTSVDKVVFATKTSLGVDTDTKPATLSVGYDRIEGYFGPSYDEGAVPPVVASIRSYGGVFNAEVSQVYATGDAAENVVKTGEVECTKNLAGGKKMMFFGTTTVIGLKAGFAGYVPESFTFGYKRKEFSYIPLGKKKVGGIDVDTYPSVIASIDTGAKAKTFEEAGIKGDQFFATGCAAELLAKDLRDVFKKRAKDAFQVYEDAVQGQQLEAAGILRCYAGVRAADLSEVWKDADRLKLFYDKDNFTLLMQLHATKKEEDLRTANKVYAGDIINAEGLAPARLELLKVHRDFVCEQAKK